MISNEIIQAALISYLKADTSIISFLTQFNAQDEIRESEYQAREFVYPAIRLELGVQIEEGNPPCYSTLPFTVYCYSEEASSKQCNQLAGLVNTRLIRNAFSGTGFTTGLIVTDGNLSARQVNSRSQGGYRGEWQAPSFYRVNIYGGSF